MKTALFLASVASAHAASIWIEGEAASTKTVHRHGWYDSVKRELFSGNGWLSNYGAAGTATYEVVAEEAGNYTLWARLNPVAAKMQWRTGGGEWTEIDMREPRQQQNVAGDGRIDHRFVAWVKVGATQLAKGTSSVEFRFDGGTANSGGLDCFCLTTEPWVPQGITKPGSSAAAGPGEWFPLLADEDSFDPASVIDMSKLVPAPAGKFGTLKSVKDKLFFEKVPNAPVKFWGVGANLEPGKYSREQQTRRIKYLRKFGVNAVRQHAVFDELTTGGKLDPKKLDEYDWWFAELKKHGIYTGWSVFYHFRIGPDDGYAPELYAELPKGDTYGLITSSPELWRIRNQWLVKMLQHKNPYTGLRYCEDPALITVEMNNEDSIFFWNPLGELANPTGKAPEHAKRLRQRFAAWVKARYKSDDELKAAWGVLKSGDSVNATELAIMSPWELDGSNSRGPFAGQPRRAGDYIRFLAEMQRGNFEECEKAIRSTGFQALTITTAWQVGGASSDAANLWTDTVGGMIDRHNYTGGGAGGHGIAEGKVNNFSHLSAPGGGIFSIGMKQVEDLPFAVTEWTQSAPNRWKLECAPIFAFYGMGLQGWDASWHFAQSGTRIGDGWPRMSSYATDTPHYIGQFPALAFAVHRGHVKEGPIVAARRLTEGEIFSGTDPLKQDATQGGYDAKTLIVNGGTPAEAFAIGRVTVGFGGGKTEQADFSKFTDAQTLRSATGELTWDYGRGRIVIATLKTQGIIGKPGTEPVKLPGVTATVTTPFVSLLFTPLDDQPLAAARRILITALAQDKQTGARYNADGTMLESTGTAPLLMEPVQATLKFVGASPKRVMPCDHYGVPMKDAVPIAADGSFKIDGTHRAYYYEVKR